MVKYCKVTKLSNTRTNGNEIVHTDTDEYSLSDWTYCDRHDDFICSNCEAVSCDKCWAKSCYYCLNYDCKVMEHYKETHPHICVQCHGNYLHILHIYNPKVRKCEDCSDSFSCKVEGCDWTLQP